MDELTFELMRSYNREKAVVFSTPQMYRHDRLEFCKQSLEDAKKHNYILGLKPVRGAYMEKERKRAADMGYPSPIQPDKAATDRDYDAVIIFALDNKERIGFCAATHNEKVRCCSPAKWTNGELPETTRIFGFRNCSA